MQHNFAGILTPIIKNERFFYNISSNEFFAMEASELEESFIVGKYRFAKKSFEKANSILIKESSKTDIDYLIIDEIGPLEVDKQQGLFKALNFIITKSFHFTLLLIIRKTLLDNALTILKLQNSTIMNVTEMAHHFKTIKN